MIKDRTRSKKLRLFVEQIKDQNIVLTSMDDQFEITNTSKFCVTELDTEEMYSVNPQDIIELVNANVLQSFPVGVGIAEFARIHHQYYVT